MSDHNDALSDSGWTQTQDDLYTAYGWLRTTQDAMNVNVRPVPENGVVCLWVNADGIAALPFSRPQVDELIRMLVVARSETWPPEGYDGGDDGVEQ